MGQSLCTADQLSALPTLEPASQADLLTLLAQEVRLVTMALGAADDNAEAERVAVRFERALERAMDANHRDESRHAHLQLSSALTDARRAGLKVSATVEELTLDGALGAQRLPVLTAFLNADRPT